MKKQGRLLATMGSTQVAAAVAWNGMTRDEVLDALAAVLEFLEGNHKNPLTAAGLRTGQDVRVRRVQRVHHQYLKKGSIRRKLLLQLLQEAKDIDEELILLLSAIPEDRKEEVAAYLDVVGRMPMDVTKKGKDCDHEEESD